MKVLFPLARMSFSLAWLFLLSCGAVNLSTDISRPRDGSPVERSTSRSNSGRHPAYHGVVAVYRSKQDLKGLKYETLGTLTTKPRLDRDSEESEMVLDLQSRAADIGANAILLQEKGREKDKELSRLSARAIYIYDRSHRDDTPDPPERDKFRPPPGRF